MSYPTAKAIRELATRIERYAELKYEYGSRNVQAIINRAERSLRSALDEIKTLPVDRDTANREPNDLRRIRALRPKGSRRLSGAFNSSEYPERLAGALLGRMAGCTLGVPVEEYGIRALEELARENGDPIPPKDYWRRVPNPYCVHYGRNLKEDYTRGKIRAVPVDDDIAYTLLGLLILEDYGPDFTTEDVAKAWISYLPTAYTAERIALANVTAGVPAKRAAEEGNPFREWIGGNIRSDPWGYVAPGLPERAAGMAYRDAYLSHRRNGIYGAMYFSAAIAAAFVVDDPVEALRIGLTEIPRECAMARAVRWALRKAPDIRNYREARAAVDRKFKGMNRAHTINNACMTIWAITVGGTDFTRVIGEASSMGLDNDCRTATAGSIVGAVIGKRNVPRHWYKKFNNTVLSYLIGKPRFSITGLIKRFERQARKVCL